MKLTDLILENEITDIFKSILMEQFILRFDDNVLLESDVEKDCKWKSIMNPSPGATSKRTGNKKLPKLGIDKNDTLSDYNAHVSMIKQLSKALVDSDKCLKAIRDKWFEINPPVAAPKAKKIVDPFDELIDELKGSIKKYYAYLSVDGIKKVKSASNFDMSLIEAKDVAIWLSINEKLGNPIENLVEKLTPTMVSFFDKMQDYIDDGAFKVSTNDMKKFHKHMMTFKAIKIELNFYAGKDMNIASGEVIDAYSKLYAKLTELK